MKTITLTTYGKSKTAIIFIPQIAAIVEDERDQHARGTRVFLVGGNEVLVQEGAGSILRLIEDKLK